jgi:hypothetical protein
MRTPYPLIPNEYEAKMVLLSYVKISAANEAYVGLFHEALPSYAKYIIIIPLSL